MKVKNQWMGSMLLFFFLYLLVFYPVGVLAQNPAKQVPITLEEQIFQDVVLDFAFYESLVHDVYYDETKLLPRHANSMGEAVQFLSAGFCPPLAELIAGYYLKCSPTGIQVIPMDSIPIITLENQKQTQITLISKSTACVSCRFYNCYEWGDEYLYRVYVRKDDLRWIIEDLSLQTDQI